MEENRLLPVGNADGAFTGEESDRTIKKTLRIIQTKIIKKTMPLFGPSAAVRRGSITQAGFTGAGPAFTQEKEGKQEAWASKHPRFLSVVMVTVNQGKWAWSVHRVW